MAIIIEKRGRGKFKPSPNYEVGEVKNYLILKLKKKGRHLQIVVRK